MTNVSSLFFSRYDVLYHDYLAKVWQNLTEAQIRQHPVPQVNSIAWNLWHMARAEDAGMNRFVADQPQVFEDGWLEKLGVHVRHHGTGMTREEVADLSAQIDLSALQDYVAAVTARTREIVPTLNADTLETMPDGPYVRQVLVYEGVASSRAEWLVEVYSHWTKAKCLMHFGLTHPFQHVGEISTLAALMDVDVFGV